MNLQNWWLPQRQRQAHCCSELTTLRWLRGADPTNTIASANSPKQSLCFVGFSVKCMDIFAFGCLIQEVSRWCTWWSRCAHYARYTVPRSVSSTMPIIQSGDTKPGDFMPGLKLHRPAAKGRAGGKDSSAPPGRMPSEVHSSTRMTSALACARNGHEQC